MTTLHPSAPASRIAQARHPLLRREIRAFQPLSAQIALTSISMSLPNCLRLVSECIACSAAPLWPFVLSFWACGEARGSAPGPPPLALLSDEFRLCELQSQLGLLLVMGENGISFAGGCGLKFVMASTTSTRGALSRLDVGGKMLGGAMLVAESARSCSMDQVGLVRSSERWIDVYV